MKRFKNRIGDIGTMLNRERRLRMGGTVAFYGRRDLIAAAILQNLDMAEGVAQMLNHVWQGGIMLKN